MNFDKVKEFSGIVWKNFWSPKNKIQRWGTRIIVLLIIAMSGLSLIAYPNQLRKKSLSFDSQYAFTDPGQNYFTSKYNEAVKEAKSLKGAKDQTSPEYLSKENNIIITQMAENPDTNVVSPGLQFENQFLSLNKNKITPDEKSWFAQSVALTAGETGYVYTTDLLKSVGIDKDNYVVGFDMYSGNLYVDPKVLTYYPQKEKVIKERAKEIWNSSALSKRVPTGLKIHFLSQNSQ